MKTEALVNELVKRIHSLEIKGATKEYLLGVKHTKEWLIDQITEIISTQLGSK